MNRIRVLVVDDEPHARANLVALLRGHQEIDLVGEFENGDEALRAMLHIRADLVLLDIQMPECNGFELLESLGTQVPPAVIFVTAYSQYAIKAFETGAVDYLLKPFDNERFELALARAKGRIQAYSTLKQPSRLIIRSAGQITFLNVNEIDYINAADYYACLHVGAKSHLIRRTINDLETELNQYSFCRIHRSTIVNLTRVEALICAIDGEYEVKLTSGVTLRLSRRYRKALHGKLALNRKTQHGP